MHGEALLLVLMLLIGCVAFFFGIIYLVWSVLSWLGRGVWHVIHPGRWSRTDGGPVISLRRRVCRNPKCRKVEHRKARYCSQCGVPLDELNLDHS